jgi:hypothetical protein
MKTMNLPKPTTTPPLSRRQLEKQQRERGAWINILILAAVVLGMYLYAFSHA